MFNQDDIDLLLRLGWQQVQELKAGSADQPESPETVAEPAPGDGGEPE